MVLGWVYFNKSHYLVNPRQILVIMLVIEPVLRAILIQFVKECFFMIYALEVIKLVGYYSQ